MFLQDFGICSWEFVLFVVFFFFFSPRHINSAKCNISCLQCNRWIYWILNNILYVKRKIYNVNSKYAWKWKIKSHFPQKTNYQNRIKFHAILVLKRSPNLHQAYETHSWLLERISFATWNGVIWAASTIKISIWVDNEYCDFIVSWSCPCISHFRIGFFLVLPLFSETSNWIMCNVKMELKSHLNIWFICPGLGTFFFVWFFVRNLRSEWFTIAINDSIVIILLYQINPEREREREGGKECQTKTILL